jgi:hypothetical protein
VLCVTRTTTSPKHVYTVELWVLLEKLKCEIPGSMFLQNPYMILSWILDMLWELARLGSVHICTKLLKESFYINYLVILINLLR